jgi:hypothetical protein
VQRLQKANPGLINPNRPDINRPLIIPGSGFSPPIIAPSLIHQERQTIESLSHYAGGAAVMALADFLDDSKILSLGGHGTTFSGGMGAASTAISSEVLKKVQKYDKLLKEFHGLENHRAVPATLNRKRAELKRAWKELDELVNRKGMRFLHERAVQTREVKNLTGRIVRESIPISS